MPKSGPTGVLRKDYGLLYARMLSDDVTAVYVMIEPAESEKVRKKWETWGEGVRLVMLNSPYRLLLEPLLEYIAEIARQRQPGIVIVNVPYHVHRENGKHAI